MPITLQRTVVAPTVGKRRSEPGQCIGQIAGAMPRAHFEIAAGEQEEHEHGDRIEVHVTAAAQRLDEARGVDDRDRERDRNIHAEPPRLERAQGAGEERSGGIEDNRRRHEEAEPAKQLVGGSVE